MRCFYLLLCLLLITGCAVSPGEPDPLPPPAEIPTVAYDYHLADILFDDAGIAYYDGLPVNGTIFYDNGAMKLCRYKNGVQDGFAYEFYPNGALYRQMRYKNGLLDGFAKKYDVSGGLVEILNYNAGKLDGESAYKTPGGWVKFRYGAEGAAD